jgi:hypothetical protein
MRNLRRRRRVDVRGAEENVPFTFHFTMHDYGIR